jgi:hypothetical protein
MTVEVTGGNVLALWWNRGIGDLVLAFDGDHNLLTLAGAARAYRWPILLTAAEIADHFPTDRPTDEEAERYAEVINGA